MLTKENKKEVVQDLSDAIKNSGSVVFVNFHGLTVAMSQAMRRALKAENVSYSVARKTLIGRALDASTLIGTKPEFTGELAIAYGEDILSPARGIYEFAKKHEGKVNIVGGIFEGNYKSALEMIEIASIPPIQTLRGMFVNIINAPIQRFAVVLNAVAEKK